MSYLISSGSTGWWPLWWLKSLCWGFPGPPQSAMVPPRGECWNCSPPRATRYSMVAPSMTLWWNLKVPSSTDNIQLARDDSDSSEPRHSRLAHNTQTLTTLENSQPSLASKKNSHEHNKAESKKGSEKEWSYCYCVHSHTAFVTSVKKRLEPKCLGGGGSVEGRGGALQEWQRHTDAREGRG